MAKNDTLSDQNKRQYLRIDTVFPIEFQITSEDRMRTLSDLKEGFTRNIGKGGICITTKIVKGASFPDLLPKKTKLKLIINIPPDREPLESFATVEWVEKYSGSLLDTYTFGASYDYINEEEYERILGYLNWIRHKPKVLTGFVIVLSLIIIFGIGLMIKSNKLQNIAQQFLISKDTLVKIESELERKKLEVLSIQKELENLQTQRETEESLRDELESKQSDLEKFLKDLEAKKNSLREEIDSLNAEKNADEEQLLENETTKSETETIVPEELGSEEVIPKSAETVASKSPQISQELLRLEETNYNRFRELILQEKVQSLEIYCSSHKSSIYYPAALFALAEIQYKARNNTFAKANYTKLVENFPDSIYGLYSGHRLDQINSYYNYNRYSLKDLSEQYNLPALYDYKKLEPYIKE